MEDVIAAVLILIVVVASVSGVCYYAYAKGRENQLLAESRMALAKVEEAADILRALTLTGQKSAALQHEFSSGFFQVGDDGVSIVQVTVGNSVETLAAAEHHVFIYVGKYSAYSSTPYYPSGVNDSALASTSVGFDPIYAYSDVSYSYLVLTNRFYVTVTQNQAGAYVVQIFYMTLTPQGQAKSPPKGTVHFQSNSTVQTFTYNLLSAAPTLTLTSGDKQATFTPQLPLLPGSTLQVELHQVNIQATFSQS